MPRCPQMSPRTSGSAAPIRGPWQSKERSSRIGVGKGMALPALRTARAVFPHTALQSVVSSSGVSRLLPSWIKGEQPGLSEEGVGPAPSVLPLTPLPGADTMRSVHTEASTQDQSRDLLPASAPRLADSALPVLACPCPLIAHPPSCPPSLGPVLLPGPLRGSLRIAVI